MLHFLLLVITLSGVLLMGHFHQIKSFRPCSKPRPTLFDELIYPLKDASGITSCIALSMLCFFALAWYVRPNKINFSLVLGRENKFSRTQINESVVVLALYSACFGLFYGVYRSYAHSDASLQFLEPEPFGNGKNAPVRVPFLSLKVQRGATLVARYWQNKANWVRALRYSSIFVFVFAVVYNLIAGPSFNFINRVLFPQVPQLASEPLERFSFKVINLTFLVLSSVFCVILWHSQRIYTSAFVVPSTRTVETNGWDALAQRTKRVAGNDRELFVAYNELLLLTLKRGNGVLVSQRWMEPIPAAKAMRKRLFARIDETPTPFSVLLNNFIELTAVFSENIYQNAALTPPVKATLAKGRLSWRDELKAEIEQTRLNGIPEFLLSDSQKAVQQREKNSQAARQKSLLRSQARNDAGGARVPKQDTLYDRVCSIAQQSHVVKMLFTATLQRKLKTVVFAEWRTVEIALVSISQLISLAADEDPYGAVALQLSVFLNALDDLTEALRHLEANPPRSPVEEELWKPFNDQIPVPTRAKVVQSFVLSKLSLAEDCQKHVVKAFGRSVLESLRDQISSDVFYQKLFSEFK